MKKGNNEKHEKYQKFPHKKKVNSEKAIEVNNELIINVDEQHINMKHLKETCDIEDEDEGQQIIAARTLKKKHRLVRVGHVIKILPLKMA